MRSLGVKVVTLSASSNGERWCNWMANPTYRSPGKSLLSYRVKKGEFENFWYPLRLVSASESVITDMGCFGSLARISRKIGKNPL